MDTGEKNGDRQTAPIPVFKLAVIEAVLQFFLNPFSGLMRQLVQKPRRLDFNRAVCVHGDSDAGNEFVGIDLSCFAVERNLNGIEHLMFRNT